MKRTLCIISFVLAASTGAQAQDSMPEVFDFLLEEEPDVREFVPPPDVELAEPKEPLITFAGDALGLAGAWTITSERNLSHCSFNGTAKISIDVATGGHTCELIMRDYCEGSHDGIIRQTCKISGSGDAVIVDSIILEALHGPLAGYSADNFDLQKQDNGTLTGNLRSYSRDPVIWRRMNDGIS